MMTSKWVVRYKKSKKNVYLIGILICKKNIQICEEIT
jgi:hypothetical protein